MCTATLRYLPRQGLSHIHAVTLGMVAAFAGFVLFIAGVALALSIVLIARPRRLIPPALQHQPGLISGAPPGRTDRRWGAGLRACRLTKRTFENAYENLKTLLEEGAL